MIHWKMYDDDDFEIFYPLTCTLLLGVVDTYVVNKAYKDFATRRERYLYLAFFSLEAIASDTCSGRACGWFAEASWLLQSMTVSPEHLPLFGFSLKDQHISYQFDRYEIRPFERISIDYTFRSLGYPPW